MNHQPVYRYIGIVFATVAILLPLSVYIVYEMEWGDLYAIEGSLLLGANITFFFVINYFAYEWVLQGIKNEYNAVKDKYQE